MAVIGKIRRNNWLLIALIGLGLLAFILMDSMSGDRSIGATSGNTIGNIAGNKISYSEFNRMYEVRSKNFESNDSYGQRSSLWEYLVEKSIIQNEADALGLGVSTQELKDLQFGSPANLSPLMASRFPAGGGANQFNPNPQPDMERIMQFKTAIDEGTNLTPDFIDFWRMHEGEVRKDRIQRKLNNLVSKSMFTPSWMVEKAYSEQNQRITFNYVKIPFDNVADSEVTLTDADLTSYLTTNAAKYSQDEETRKIGYVTIDVVASSADSTQIRGDVAKLGEQFATATDATSFVERYNGQSNPQWLTVDELGDDVKNQAFSQAVGSTVGPYLEGKAYTVAKIVDRRVLPDSAKCRHILISDPMMQRGTKPVEGQYVAWEKTADSLKVLLESGQANFDSLAAKFSTDGGSKDKGGFYDWAGVNQYVPEFNDMVFFKGDLKKLYAVRTDFGVHLIEPLGRKNINNTERVRVSYVRKNIKPSKTTTRTAYTKATELIRNNSSLDALKAAAEANPALQYNTTNPVTTNDHNLLQLGATEESRKMVKFAFENSIGEVSSDVYRFQDQVDFYDNKYVVSAVESVQGAGKPSIDNVRDMITPIVRNMKKGEIIKGKINTQDLFSIANTFESQVDTASNVSFSNPNVPGLGQEAKVVAAAFKINQNAVSQPVIGENGVYIVQTTSKPDSPAPSNLGAIRNTISQPSKNQVATGMIQSMKKNANIEDKRSSFF